MGLGRGYAGAAASAIAQRTRAIENYNLAPNYCVKCGSLIAVRDGDRVYIARRKKFCNSSCAAKFNNSGIQRNFPTLAEIPCVSCGNQFRPRKSTQKLCSLRCSGIWTASRITKEEMFRRGFTDPVKSKQRRLRQLVVEEGIAEELRGQGWEIFSPTVVCDRIGIKDGRVSFLEFKPIDDQRLRPGQQRIADLVPEMYKVIAR